MLSFSLRISPASSPLLPLRFSTATTNSLFSFPQPEWTNLTSSNQQHFWESIRCVLESCPSSQANRLQREDTSQSARLCLIRAWNSAFLQLSSVAPLSNPNRFFNTSTSRVSVSRSSVDMQIQYRMFDLIQNRPVNLRTIEQETSFSSRKSSRLSLAMQRKALKFGSCNLSQLVLNWRHLPKPTLILQINKCDNIFEHLKLLFAIAEDMGWREWSSIMQILIQKVHNKVLEDRGIGCLERVPQFENKLGTLCCLKDKALQRHVVLLLEVIVGFNKAEQVVDEGKLSLSVLDLASEDNGRLFWVMAGMDVSFECIWKSLNRTLFLNNELPFCTMLANCLVDCQEIQALEIFSHPSFVSLVSNIFSNSDVYCLRREAHLVINNFMSKSMLCFGQAVQNCKLVETLLKENSEETWFTLEILLQGSRKLNFQYITLEGCRDVARKLSHFNERIWLTFCD